MTDDIRPFPLLRLVAWMAAFLVVGGPVAFVLWHELSELLYGRFEDVQVALLGGSALLFAAIVWALARFVRRVGGPKWEEEAL